MAIYISNLTVHTGTDFTQTFVFEDEASNSALDISNYTGSGQLKRYDTSSKAADLTLDFSQGATGRLTATMTAATTENIKAGRYFYDIRLVSDTGTVDKVVEGIVIVKQSVTRGCLLYTSDAADE